jgi:P pilus assembly chaperone PapD
VIALAQGLRLLFVFALALVSASAGASAARQPVALMAAPARVVLAGTTRTAVRVTNSGTKRVVVDVSRAGFALTLRGRPRIVRRGARSAASWLKLRPMHLVLLARTSGTLLVSARVPRKAEPGDHDALVLLTTRPSAGARVGVRIRLGLVVVVRAPGIVVRRLELRRLWVARRSGRRLLELRVANRGNVTETLARVHVTVLRARTGRRLARLGAARRDVRPHSQGILEFRLRRRMRGAVSARVVIPAAHGRRGIRRIYALRL